MRILSYCRAAAKFRLLAHIVPSVFGGVPYEWGHTSSGQQFPAELQLINRYQAVRSLPKGSSDLYVCVSYHIWVLICKLSITTTLEPFLKHARYNVRIRGVIAVPVHQGTQRLPPGSAQVDFRRNFCIAQRSSVAWRTQLATDCRSRRLARQGRLCCIPTLPPCRQPDHPQSPVQPC